MLLLLDRTIQSVEVVGGGGGGGGGINYSTIHKHHIDHRHQYKRLDPFDNY